MSVPRILVAMSGGVDSSVAALLLQREGYEAVGLTAELFGSASAAGPCCGRAGIASAKAACDVLGIAHHSVDLTELFEQQVIGRFIAEYQAGRTPNPCSDCNRFIKFDAFFALAQKYGCELIATGHHARIKPRQDDDALPPTLHTGKDAEKDQSYFLACIPAETLSSIRFPVGELSKPEVRRLATEANLPTAGRAESQDICFLEGSVGIAELISWHTGKEPQPGPIVNEQGRVLGEHPGVEHFTVGQRKGLRLGGGSEGLVVHRTDPANNTVIVAQRDAHPVAEVMLKDFHDMAPGMWRSGETVQVRARYRQPLWPATIHLQQAAKGEEALPVVIEPLVNQYGLAPGQWLVGYRGELVLFGGIMDQITYRL